MPVVNETYVFNLKRAKKKKKKGKNYRHLKKLQYKITQVTFAFMTVELTTTDAAKTLSEKSA